jgi:hypothetical protein
MVPKSLPRPSPHLGESAGIVETGARDRRFRVHRRRNVAFRANLD